jgi:hypothetical protein
MSQVRLDHAERAEYTISARSFAAAPCGLFDGLRSSLESMVPAEGIEPTA